MKMKTHKVISFCIVLALIISMSQAFATDLHPEDTVSNHCFQSQDVYYFSEENGQEILTIAAYPNGNIEMITRNANDTFYKYAKLNLNDLNKQRLDYSDKFWQNIKDYVYSKDLLNNININDVVSVSKTVTRSTTTILEEFLEEIYGSEYSGKNIATINTAPIRRVSEDLSFLVQYKDNYTATKVLTYASFITGILSIPATSTMLAVMSTIFGGLSIAVGDAVEWHLASAQYTQYGWCGGNRYNAEGRTISYRAYKGPVGLDIDTDDYSDLQSNYFDNTDRIMEDAYMYWLNDK